MAEDPRLDRLPQFDPASRRFRAVADIEDRKRRSYTWGIRPRLDQGQEGACVGFGIGQELLARPAVADPMIVTARYAREIIYWGAQQADEWDGGSYPGAEPQYEGTSVLAGLKTAVRLGWFDEYRWAFGLDDLILAVGYKGPAVIGTNWYTGMFSTDVDGYLRVTGDLAGGHCILVNGVSVRLRRFMLTNSWGTDWGFGGQCYISWEDMDRLLHEQGEAAIPAKRHRVPRVAPST